jgi:hypothetical protein
MARTKMLVIALGTAIAMVAPTTLALAQSGDALAKAEFACIERGVRPQTPSFEACVRRGAHDVCTSYGIPPETLNDRQCLNTGTARRTETAPVAYRLLHVVN